MSWLSNVAWSEAGHSIKVRGIDNATPTTGTDRMNGGCGARSCCRATSAITAPGAIASATIRPFSTSADNARYFRMAPNNLRVVTNVDHNVTPSSIPRIAIVHCFTPHSATWGESTAHGQGIKPADRMCPKKKAPRFPAGPQRGRAVANLHLRDKRPRGFLEAPELEAEAHPNIEVAGAHWTILRPELVCEPDLQADRTEVIADQATGGSLP